MQKPQFWRLHSPSSAKFVGYVKEAVKFEKVVCPLNDDHLRGGNRLTDLSVELTDGAAKDVVWTWGGECLLQHSTLALFRAKSFTGFEVKPVNVNVKESNIEPPRLWELIVRGWAGLAPADSGVKLIDECDGCGLLTYTSWTSPEGLIDPLRWDATDFFQVWPIGYVFVSQRVATVIRENKVSGVALTPLSKLKFPMSIIPILSGTRLSRWMPVDRAHYLGDKWGIF